MGGYPGPVRRRVIHTPRSGIHGPLISHVVLNGERSDMGGYPGPVRQRVTHPPCSGIHSPLSSHIGYPVNGPTWAVSQTQSDTGSSTPLAPGYTVP